jgi:hypothetical protein
MTVILVFLFLLRLLYCLLSRLPCGGQLRMEFAPILLEVHCNACLLWTRLLVLVITTVEKVERGLMYRSLLNCPIYEKYMATAHPVLEVSVQ